MSDSDEYGSDVEESDAEVSVEDEFENDIAISDEDVTGVVEEMSSADIDTDTDDQGIEGELDPDDEVVVHEVVDVSHPGPTGDPRVDDALARLDDLTQLPTADHVRVYDEVQQRLASALGDLDPHTSTGT